MCDPKKLSYYLQLPYRIHVEPQEFEGEIFYTAYAKELGKYSCYGTGDSPEEAIQSFLSAKDDFIRFLCEKGEKIPEPDMTARDYSGYFSVRTSPQLHRELTELAKEASLSLNQFVNQVLAHAAGRKTTEKDLKQELLNEIYKMLQNQTAEINKQLSYRFKQLFGQEWNKYYADNEYLQTV